MKKWHQALLVIVGAAAAYSTFSRSASQTFGPLSCSYCSLQQPEPDISTSIFLDDYYRRYYYSGIIGVGEHYKFEPGDTFVVCNSLYCGYYVLTSDRKWLGVKIQKKQQYSFNEQIKRMPRELADQWITEQKRESGVPASWHPAPAYSSRKGSVSVGPVKRM